MDVVGMCEDNKHTYMDKDDKKNLADRLGNQSIQKDQTMKPSTKKFAIIAAAVLAVVIAVKLLKGA